MNSNRKHVFNHRAQMTAPFELLVAVIIMGFVILVGMQALDQLKVEQCKGQVSKSLQDLKLALEAAEKFKSPQRFVFDPPSCYKNEVIQLVVEEKPTTCSLFCGGSRRSCTILNYFVEGPISDRVCVDISPTTLFLGDTSLNCPPSNPDRYIVINPKSPPQTGPRSLPSIPRGSYEILNQSSGSSAFTTLCMFKSK